MKTFIKILIIVTLTVTTQEQLFSQNPIIQAIVNETSGDSIYRNVALLQNLERYTLNNNYGCYNYLRNYLERFDFDTVYFQNYKQGWLPNIIAVKYGTTFPDSVYVVGAHYDTYTSGAPGADDNASGVSGVLETSRILSNYKFKKTLLFVLFSGEELGFKGSIAFVNSSINNNINISGMINLDMIAFLNGGDSLSVSVSINNSSLELANIVVHSSSLYVPGLLCVIDSTSIFVGASDHSSFWTQNIPALNLEDEVDYISGNYNPYVHSSSDTIGISVNSIELAELITKTAVASMIELAEIELDLSTLEMKINGNVSIYPNPTSNIININQNQTDNAIIEIYNIYSQKINSYKMHDKKELIDFSSYPKGLYFVRVFCNQFDEIDKIIRK